MSRNKDDSSMNRIPSEIKGFEDGKEEDFKPKISFFARIPFWVKAISIKYWICGVIFFFVNMGLANLIWGESLGTERQLLIEVLIGGILYGAAYYFFEGFLLQACERVDGEGRNWVICYSRSPWVIWLDVVYGLIWAVCAYFFDAYFALLLDPFSWAWWIFREPFTFALVGLTIEMLFIGFKDLIVYIIRKVRGKEED